MSALIELKYFNTFWLKRIKSVADVTPGTTRNYWSHIGATFTIPGQADLLEMNVGQQVTMPYIDGNGDSQFYSSYIVKRFTDFKFEAADVLVGTVDTAIIPVLTFGKIINFDNIPQSYADSVANDWVIEESRIRGGYNNTTVDFGVKAYLVEDEPKQLHRFSSLIHSGILNSRTGVNQTNQFSVAGDITKTIDPANGSIQKL